MGEVNSDFWVCYTDYGVHILDNILREIE